MIKKIVLVAAAGLAIAAGSLGSAESAMAQGMMHQGPSMHHRHRVCEPIFKKVRMHMGHQTMWKRVKVGETCRWMR